MKELSGNHNGIRSVDIAKKTANQKTKCLYDDENFARSEFD